MNSQDSKMRNYLDASKSDYSNGFTLSGILAGFTVAGFVELTSDIQGTTDGSLTTMYVSFLCSSVFFIFSLLSALIMVMSITREIRNTHSYKSGTVLTEGKYKKLEDLTRWQPHFVIPFLLGLVALFVAICSAASFHSTSLGWATSILCTVAVLISAHFGIRTLR